MLYLRKSTRDKGNKKLTDVVNNFGIKGKQAFLWLLCNCLDKC